MVTLWYDKMLTPVELSQLFYDVSYLRVVILIQMSLINQTVALINNISIFNNCFFMGGARRNFFYGRLKKHHEVPSRAAPGEYTRTQKQVKMHRKSINKHYYWLWLAEKKIHSMPLHMSETDLFCTINQQLLPLREDINDSLQHWWLIDQYEGLKLLIDQ